jgi:hypothetical protein
VLEQQVAAFVQTARAYAGALKHHGFHEEREWRLLSAPFPPGSSEIAYRRRGQVDIPYYPFRLAEGSVAPALREIRLGPRRDEAQRREDH